MSEKLTTRDGVELYIEHHGEHCKPLIIWSHGFTGSARNWRSTIRQLPHFQHIIYDLRGHSRSAAPLTACAYSLQKFVDDLCDIVNQYGAQTQYLAGLSFGAVISFAASQQLAGAIESQVLASLPDPLAQKSISGQATAFAQAIIQHGLEHAGEMFVWGEQSGMSARDAAFVKQGFLEHPAFAIASILQNALTTLPQSQLMSAQLQDSQMATLLLYGEMDEAARAYSSRVLNNLVKSDHILGYEVPGGGHLLNLTSQKIFCEKMSQFFSPHS